MPRYDFECQTCRKTFEIKASLAEYAVGRREKRFVCPECGTAKIARVFSAPGILSASGSGQRDGGRCCPGGKCD